MPPPSPPVSAAVAAAARLVERGRNRHLAVRRDLAGLVGGGALTGAAPGSELRAGFRRCRERDRRALRGSRRRSPQPQSMPAGSLVTLPRPRPSVSTVIVSVPPLAVRLDLGVDLNQLAVRGRRVGRVARGGEEGGCRAGRRRPDDQVDHAGRPVREIAELAHDLVADGLPAHVERVRGELRVGGQRHRELRGDRLVGPEILHGCVISQLVVDGGRVGSVGDGDLQVGDRDA